MKSEKEKLLALHKRTKGKCSLVPIEKVTKENYTSLISPGSEQLATYALEKNEKTAYTGRDETVCIVSNGSHVHGKGNIGAQAVLPILEAKALLLTQFGGVKAVPLPVDVYEADKFSQFLESIAPACGAIVLDGVAEPFLQSDVLEEYPVPVIETNRHGIAVATLAGLINAHKVVKKNLHHSRIAIFGTGPVTVSLVSILQHFGVGDIVVVDRDGILSSLRTNVEGEKEWLAQVTNNEQRTGSALEAVTGADVLISLSKANVLKEEYIRMMAQHAVVFAFREPEPEIAPQTLEQAGAAVVATKSFAYANYVTDALVIPYLVKAVLEQQVKNVTANHCIEIAKALAGMVATPTKHKILPTVFDRRIAKQITSLF